LPVLLQPTTVGKFLSQFCTLTRDKAAERSSASNEIVESSDEIGTFRFQESNDNGAKSGLNLNSLLPDSGNSAPEKIDSALNKERNYFQESTAGNENYLTGYGAPSGTATNTDNANQAFNVGYGEEYNYVANSQSATSLLTNQNPANPSQLQCWTCQSENWLDCMESGKLAFCEPNITSCQGIS
jgi:hypothetical protein